MARGTQALAAILCLLISSCWTKPRAQDASSHDTKRSGTVVLYDDFTSGKVDPAHWNRMATGWGGGGNQFNMWSPEPINAFVRGGLLYIKPTLTVNHFGPNYLDTGVFDAKALWGECTSIDPGGRACTLSGRGKIPPVMSAMLTSKQTIRYGKVEVVAKLPKGDWLHPAIWMMAKDRVYGGWPLSGEIDIMEARGNEHYYDKWGHHGSKGRNYTHAALHYGVRWDKWHKRDVNAEYRISDTTFADSFHKFWLDWTAEYIRMGVDDVTMMNWTVPAEGYFQHGHFQNAKDPWANATNAAPFDQPFYLILNVAVGGNWFWQQMINEPYLQPWNDTASKEDQYVQFWNARHLWQPTWHGDNVAMRVKSVKLTQY